VYLPSKLERTLQLYFGISSKDGRLTRWLKRKVVLVLFFFKEMIIKELDVLQRCCLDKATINVILSFLCKTISATSLSY
jgi:hypothetical protein